MSDVAVFRKGSSTAPPGYFRWEAAGLAWLADAPGGALVAEVVGAGPDHLDLRRLSFVNPDPAMAEAFGVGLAHTHDAGAPAFGAPPEGWHGDGFLGPVSELLPLHLRPVASWGEFYAGQRLLPALAMGVDRGVYHRSDIALFEAIARRVAAGEFDDGSPPARLHGDLWSGNVLWTAAGGVLIDPAAHGGHRETDLAMLALFGCPHWDFVIGGYLTAHRLDAQWPHRVALHQLHPLMVHAVLFGGDYPHRAVELAKRYR
ncbi:fructosamine kinase family protein [Nostocoides sp. HKS02]|uniref:fructosamine kinase family protein n=1 Tax=Nostocoides sp. HKS02 TaxID=1813880 RepID=UPI0018A866D4|nr:fructosamine kinase family protein [Tetrasphaera sp. HKS02]